LLRLVKLTDCFGGVRLIGENFVDRGWTGCFGLIVRCFGSQVISRRLPVTQAPVV
jgi:hypothetical protein